MIRCSRARRLALALAAFWLGGCTPRNVLSAIFPTKYAVASTVTFEDGGLRSSQTIIHRCKIVDQRGSISQGTGAHASGDRHWLRRRDGSLLIVGRLAACPVAGPAPGFTSTYGVEYWDMAENSYLFDDAAAPSSVQVIETRALFLDGSPRITKARFTVLRNQAATETWKAAFPGRKALVPSDGLREAGMGAPLRPGMFVGIAAYVEERPDGSRCENPDGRPGPVLLPRDSMCRSGGRRIGYLPVEMDPRWRSARIAAGPMSTKVRDTLYDARRLIAVAAPASKNEWTPKVCVDGLCVTRAGFDDDNWLFYYPRENRTVTVMMAYERFSPDMFER